EHAAQPGDDGAVARDVVDLRQEALRVDRWNVLRGVAWRAEERERGDVTVADRAEAVQRQRVADVEAGVERGRGGVDLGIADHEGLLAQRRLVWRRRAGKGPRTVGPGLLVELGRDVHEAALAAQGQARVARELVLRP